MREHFELELTYTIISDDHTQLGTVVYYQGHDMVFARRETTATTKSETKRFPIPVIELINFASYKEMFKHHAKEAIEWILEPNKNAPLNPQP